jgi:serine/threonine protein phosphatase PrpC
MSAPLQAAGDQLQGMRRRQEDAWKIESFSGKELLAVVTDGLGGHPAGDVASKEGVAEFSRQFAARRTESQSGPREWLREAVVKTDRHLIHLQQRQRDLRGMATTLVALYVRDHEFWAASVGDSYLLLRRQERFLCLNELHSEMGGVTSCLGFNLTRIDLAEGLLVEPGDRYLLASDGINTLDGEEVSGLLGAAADPAAAVKALLGAIQDSAAPTQDNVTLIAVFA